MAFATWSCFPPQKLYLPISSQKNWIVETRWRNSSMSVQVFWPMSVPHATNGEHPWSSLLFAGYPKKDPMGFLFGSPLYKQRCTSAKLLAANSMTPSFKKETWRMSIKVESHHDSHMWSLFPGSPLESFGRFSVGIPETGLVLNQMHKLQLSPILNQKPVHWKHLRLTPTDLRTIGWYY